MKIRSHSGLLNVAGIQMSSYLCILLTDNELGLFII